MANKALKYFAGEVELDPKTVQNRLVLEVICSEEQRTWTKQEYENSKGALGPRVLAGHKPRDKSKPVTWDDLTLLRVTRTVKYVASPNPHVCDWRCEGAYKNSECRCSCGGRNHGIKGKADV